MAKAEGYTGAAVEKELNGIYGMYLKVAKDRKATKAEKKEAKKAGKDPDKINTGDGDDVLTKAEFIKNFEKKVKVFNWVDSKKTNVVVKSPELLFFTADKQGKKDYRLSVEESLRLPRAP